MKRMSAATQTREVTSPLEGSGWCQQTADAHQAGTEAAAVESKVDVKRRTLLGTGTELSSLCSANETPLISALSWVDQQGGSESQKNKRKSGLCFAGESRLILSLPSAQGHVRLLHFAAPIDTFAEQRSKRQTSQRQGQPRCYRSLQPGVVNVSSAVVSN